MSALHPKGRGFSLRPGPFGVRRGPSQGAGPGARSDARSQPDEQFGAFQASLLYCPQCRQATPTKERLLLILPTGNLYEYLCAQCGTSTGSKTDTNRSEVRLFLP